MSADATHKQLEPIVRGAVDVDSSGSTALLVGCRCPACGQVQFPPRPACAACSNPDPEIVALPATGTIWSCTVERLGLVFGHPYLVAQVQLDGGPIVQGYLDADFDLMPTPGTTVRTVPWILPGIDDHEGFLGFAFRPLENVNE